MDSPEPSIWGRESPPRGPVYAERDFYDNEGRDPRYHVDSPSGDDWMDNIPTWQQEALGGFDSKYRKETNDWVEEIRKMAIESSKKKTYFKLVDKRKQEEERLHREYLRRRDAQEQLREEKEKREAERQIEKKKKVNAVKKERDELKQKKEYLKKQIEEDTQQKRKEAMEAEEERRRMKLLAQADFEQFKIQERQYHEEQKRLIKDKKEQVKTDVEMLKVRQKLESDMRRVQQLKDHEKKLSSIKDLRNESEAIKEKKAKQREDLKLKIKKERIQRVESRKDLTERMQRLKALAELSADEAVVESADEGGTKEILSPRPGHRSNSPYRMKGKKRRGINYRSPPRQMSVPIVTPPPQRKEGLDTKKRAELNYLEKLREEKIAKEEKRKKNSQIWRPKQLPSIGDASGDREKTFDQFIQNGDVKEYELKPVLNEESDETSRVNERVPPNGSYHRLPENHDINATYDASTTKKDTAVNGQRRPMVSDKHRAPIDQRYESIENVRLDRNKKPVLHRTKDTGQMFEGGAEDPWQSTYRDYHSEEYLSGNNSEMGQSPEHNVKDLRRRGVRPHQTHFTEPPLDYEYPSELADDEEVQRNAAPPLKFQLKPNLHALKLAAARAQREERHRQRQVEEARLRDWKRLDATERYQRTNQMRLERARHRVAREAELDMKRDRIAERRQRKGGEEVAR